jgi:hypothetical protein
MKYLIASLALAGALVVSPVAHAVHGGSDEFLWSIIKESDFCLVYIAGEDQGYEACGGTKDDKIDEYRDYEGGDFGDDDGDDDDE